MGLYQVLPLRARVDWGAIAVKGCPAFPKAPVLMEPHHQIVSCHISGHSLGSLTSLQRCSRCILQPHRHSLGGEVLLLSRDAVGVLCSPSRQGKRLKASMQNKHTTQFISLSGLWILMIYKVNFCNLTTTSFFNMRTEHQWKCNKGNMYVYDLVWLGFKAYQPL